MDAHKNDLGMYNPFEMRKRGPILKLRDEETIIGVYGVIGPKGFFTSFGFVVKAWELEQTRE